MSQACTVLIAAPDLLPILKERATIDGGELLSFTDTEALRALEVIITRRPALVALERTFAATSRGAALINRIKADPFLTGTDVRVVASDPERARPVAVVAEASPVTHDDGQLDEAGTRRTQRHRIEQGCEVLIDRNQVTLVNLSGIGARVLSASVLRPNQRVRVSLTDEHGTVRVGGTVIWASFEIPPGAGPHYRAGIDFTETDVPAVEAFAKRHLA